MFKKRKKDGLWNAADVEKKRKGCRKGEEENSTLRKVVEKERKRIIEKKSFKSLLMGLQIGKKLFFSL